MNVPISIIAKRDNGDMYLKEIKNINYQDCINDITEGIEMDSLNTEYSFCILYDNLGIFNVVLISSGSTFSTPVCTRNIITAIVLSDATSFSMLHNHPSKNCTPSNNDINNMNIFNNIASLLDVNFVESFICSGTGVQGVQNWLHEAEKAEEE